MTHSNDGTIPEMNKLLWAIAGAIAAAVGGPPPALLQTLAWCILGLTVMDTCVGFYIAARFHEVESRKFIEKLADKGVLFLILALLGFTASVLLRNWAGAYTVATGILAYEVLSLVESGKRLARREREGNVLISLLERVGKIFSDNANSNSGMTVKQTDTQTQETTVTLPPTQK